MRLLLKDLTKPKVDIGITCNIINDMPSIDVAPCILSKASVSTSCDDVIDMPCSSKVDASSCMNYTCDPLPMVENNELKK